MLLFPWFEFARIYVKTLKFAGWKRRIRGVGFLLRHCPSDRIIQVDGMSMFFNHRVAGAYDAVLTGSLGEQETHLFLNNLLDALPSQHSVRIVDVGANIGEITLDMARRRNVLSVTAVEPQAECAKVCRIGALLNGFENKVTVEQTALAASKSLVRFSVNERSPQASGIVSGNQEGMSIWASTLDDVTANLDGPCLIKIDVEGAEMEVLKGAGHLLHRVRPLIVFEYNSLGQTQYSLPDLQSVMGTGYSIFKLRHDGMLDRDLSATWNCVAVAQDSVFAEPLARQVFQSI